MKLGVDKIFLYDNNDIDKEHFENVIQDYINKGYVEIINFRGIVKAHRRALKDCYLKNNKSYNWLMFYDIDEYIHLNGYTNIKDYLNLEKFDKCKKIYLNWVFHTDNDLINYENKTLQKRFPEIERNALFNTNYSQKVKSILRGNLSEFKLCNNSHPSHVITDSVRACNGFGKFVKLTKDFYLENSDSKYYYIDHYFSKSTEEFVNKVKKGSAVNGNNTHFKIFRIFRYFYINKPKYEKLKYILNHINIKIEE